MSCGEVRASIDIGSTPADKGGFFLTSRLTIRHSNEPGRGVQQETSQYGNVLSRIGTKLSLCDSSGSLRGTFDGKGAAPERGCKERCHGIADTFGQCFGHVIA